MGYDTESGLEKRAKKSDKKFALCDIPRFYVSFFATCLLLTSVFSTVVGVHILFKLREMTSNSTEVEVIRERGDNNALNGTLHPRRIAARDESEIFSAQPSRLLNDAGFGYSRCSNPRHIAPMPYNIPEEWKWGDKLPTYVDTGAWGNVRNFVWPEDGTRIIDGWYIVKISMEAAELRADQLHDEQMDKHMEFLKQGMPKSMDGINSTKEYFDKSFSARFLLEEWMDGICKDLELHSGFLVGGSDSRDSDRIDHGWQRMIGTMQHLYSDTGIFLLAAEKDVLEKASMWECVKSIRTVEDISESYVDQAANWEVQQIEA